jgi:uncharacterized membrane protein YvbJ
MPKDEWAVCKECGAKIKRANLEKHYAKLHPSQKVESAGEERKHAFLIRYALPLTIALMAFVIMVALSMFLVVMRGGNPLENVEFFWIFIMFACVAAFGSMLAEA